MGLIGFFQRRKEKKIEREFAEIEKNLARGNATGRGSGHTAIDRCEHMIELAGEMEETEREYTTVTSYLNDVEILQSLSPEEMKPIKDAAENVRTLTSKREKLLSKEKKISDADYSVMDREEDTLPDTIRRFQANEAYLDAIMHDMRYLEGEKAQWDMLSDDYRGAIRRYRTLTRVIFVSVIIGTAVMVALTLYLPERMSLMKYWIPVCAVLAIIAAGLYVKSLSDDREARQSEANKKKAIELLNKAKIKYVNTKNAIDYCKEKYHVKNAAALATLYENFQEAKRLRQKYSENNEDLNYFSEKLLKLLHQLRLYDERIWLSQAAALCDPREMVEVKHNLVVRRQKLRDQIAAHQEEIKEEREKVTEYLSTDPPEAEEVQKILWKIDRMAGL